MKLSLEVRRKKGSKDKSLFIKNLINILFYVKLAYYDFLEPPIPYHKTIKNEVEGFKLKKVAMFPAGHKLHLSEESVSMGFLHDSNYFLLIKNS